ncbi:HNH endonuclease [Bizionia gelidisalsuginis]|uniref:HNH endonuclease n=1 Tax=Bizionia gelidisalsuginis TaxID=291188 RepID=A0ABY3MBW6_9FLAO|nr:HNH endonuclease signature motif containing protein [Bizionia gelidisalsuginis]TYC14802.1 HNH endonuclease [Bizionia gelidisalsuginis]
MRPVDKGIAPKVYTDYGKARHDLAERLGYYCSYCEMKVFNSIEVEHILPQNQGGAVVDWNNFLLSCKYCNTIKSDHNANTTDYIWPDIDNTDLAFEYSEVDVIKPKGILTAALNIKAVSTINLMGLNRIPGGIKSPTEADTRWRSRKEVWDKAKENYNNWVQAPIIQMAKVIANCALLSGHYSIWSEVFKGDQLVLAEIDRVYAVKGLFKDLDQNGIRVIRGNGQI